MQDWNNSSFSILCSFEQVHPPPALISKKGDSFFFWAEFTLLFIGIFWAHFTDGGNSGTEQRCTFLSLHTMESSYSLHRTSLPALRWALLLAHRMALNLDSSVPRRFSPAAYNSWAQKGIHTSLFRKAIRLNSWIIDLLPCSLSSFYTYFLAYVLLQNRSKQ